MIKKTYHNKLSHNYGPPYVISYPASSVNYSKFSTIILPSSAN